MTTMAPPLTQDLSHDRDWECTGCTEIYNATAPKPWGDGTTNSDGKKTLVCNDCIRAMFERAVELDYFWPAQYGNQALNILHFECLFDMDSLEDTKSLVAYYKKLVRITLEKGARVGDPGALAQEVPEGWVQGREYQRCPKCGDGVTLHSACNHMTCSCTTDYCYICGKEVSEAEKSSHWTVGGCPRYNQPGNDNAMYDEADNEDSEGVDGDDLEVDDENEDENDDNDDSDVAFGLHAFIAYTWNMAMHTSDEGTRRIMSNVLTRGEDFRLHVESQANIDRVLTAMRRYDRRSGVSRTEWGEIVERHYFRTQMFLQMAGSDGGLVHQSSILQRSRTSPVSSGLLNQHIGGVFNMVTVSGRLQAYDWATARGIAWRRLRTGANDRANFAVFQMGPGGTLDNREAASVLLDELAKHGSRATRGRVDFGNTFLEGPSLLVEITRLARSGVEGEAINVSDTEELNPLRDIRHWIVEEEPEHPAVRVPSPGVNPLRGQAVDARGLRAFVISIAERAVLTSKDN